MNKNKDKNATVDMTPNMNEAVSTSTNELHTNVQNATTYKLSPNYLLQQVGEDTVIFPCGDEQVVDFTKMVVLNETGALLITKMENNWVTEEELVKAMMEEYEVEEEDLHNDVQEFLEAVIKKGWILECKPI